MSFGTVLSHMLAVVLLDACFFYLLATFTPPLQQNHLGKLKNMYLAEMQQMVVVLIRCPDGAGERGFRWSEKKYLFCSLQLKLKARTEENKSDQILLSAAQVHISQAIYFSPQLRNLVEKSSKYHSPPPE